MFPNTCNDSFRIFIFHKKLFRTTLVLAESTYASRIRFVFTPSFSRVSLPRSGAETAIGITYHYEFLSSRYLPCPTNWHFESPFEYTEQKHFLSVCIGCGGQTIFAGCVNVIIFKSNFPSQNFSSSDSDIRFISDPPSAQTVMDTVFSKLAGITLVFVAVLQYLPLSSPHFHLSSLLCNTWIPLQISAPLLLVFVCISISSASGPLVGICCASTMAWTFPLLLSHSSTQHISGARNWICSLRSHLIPCTILKTSLLRDAFLNTLLCPFVSISW